MNTKDLMAGMLLAVMILTSTGAALDAPFNAAFSTVYGQVTDGGAGVNGATVSLTANGVTLTTFTMTNNRGEKGFYIFELSNIPRVTDTTPLTLSATIGTKTVTTTITKGGNGLQKIDMAVQNSLTAIKVSPQTAKVVVGNTNTFAAFDQLGNPVTSFVTWNSSDTAVGTINSSTGVFKALTTGTTVITASAGSISGTATATVIQATPVLTTIEVTPPLALVPVGSTKNYVATTLDQFGNSTTATVTWSSSNTTVGTINSNTGVFTVLAAGTTVITATSGSVSGNATLVAVTPVLTTITVTPDIAQVFVGGTQNFTATTQDQFWNQFNATVAWNSSNTTVGTIDATTGVFKAIAAGEATIKATNVSTGINGTATATVTAVQPVSGVNLTVDAQAKATTVNTNATYMLTVTNTGNAQDTFNLAIQNPQNAISNLNISSITLGAGASGIAALNVTNATSGVFTVNVTASSQANVSVNQTITTTTTVNSLVTRGVTLTVDAQAKATTVNTSATYVLTVTNTGNAPDTFNLAIQNPQNANATLNMPSIALGAGMSGTVKLNVTSAAIGSFVVNVTATSNANPAVNKTITTTTTVNFNGIIKGTVFNDSNGNGIKDPTEQGLAKWTIKLGKLTAVTDANGNYSFTNLAPGRYKISEEVNKGWKPTTSRNRMVDLAPGGTVIVDFGNRRK